jgi:hypothetical protein
VTKPLYQAVGGFDGRQVGLGQNESIGHGDLLDAFGLRGELLRAVHGVDRRDHAAETEMVAQHRIGPHRRQDRERICKAGAFDDKAAEWRQQAAFAPRMQILDRGRELAADRAADATRLQHHNRLVDPLEQVMVETDFTEFVDQDRGVGQGRIEQQPLQQRRFARTEKAGDQIHRRETGWLVSQARAP